MRNSGTNPTTETAKSEIQSTLNSALQHLMRADGDPMQSEMIDIDTTNMCSHLQRKLFDENGEYHRLWLAMQDDPELTAVVRSRRLHIYRNGKKILVLAGKAAPKVIREDKLCEMVKDYE